MGSGTDIFVTLEDNKIYNKLTNSSSNNNYDFIISVIVTRRSATDYESAS